MASLQAHVAAFQVRRRVKRNLGGRADVMTMRAVFNGARRPEPRGVSYTPYTLGGVPGECVESASGFPATMTLLYLHGGGYIAGSAQMRRPITGWFAAHGIRVFVPNYRLAPEHPYPAALTDVAAVYGRGASPLGANLPAGIWRSRSCYTSRNQATPSCRTPLPCSRRPRT